MSMKSKGPAKRTGPSGCVGYCCWEDRSTVRGEPMKKSELIAAIQREILRHELTTFVDEPPVSKGGKGVVVPGCWSAGSGPTRSPSFWST